MSPTQMITDDSSPTSIRRFYSNNPFTHLDISVEPHHRLSTTYNLRNHDAIEQLYSIPVDSNDCRARYGMEDIQNHRSGSGKESRVGVVKCICYASGVTMIYSFCSPHFLSLLLVATLEKSIPAITVIANPPTTWEITLVPLSSGLDHPLPPLTSRGDLALYDRGPSVVDPSIVLDDTFRQGAGAWRNGNFAPESWTSTLATPPKKSVTRVS
jgi:hypothetical protein